MAWSRDANGWTIFTPKTDGTSAENTWVYYVDPVNGNDGTGTGYEATDTNVVGSDPFQPVGTPAAFATPNAARNAAASRNRYSASNWILLKRGTVLAAADSLLGTGLTGASTTAPVLYGAYGTGVRPIIKGGTAFSGQGSMSEEYHHVAFVGLHFYDTLKDPDHPDYVGYPTANVNVAMLGSGAWSSPGDQIMDSILFEDCRFQFMQLSIQSTTTGIPAATNIEIRRCGFGPSYSVNSGHIQCLFISNVEGLLVEDTMAYFGGWYDHPQLDIDDPGNAYHEPDIFVRNFYISGSSPGTIMRNVLSVKSASTSMQIRAGGTVEYCYHSHNPMGV